MRSAARRAPGADCLQSAIREHQSELMTDVQFTDEQAAAISYPATTQLIIAGAGSGKTTVMAERIAYLAQTIEPQLILGLTFSNKAAAHLRSAVSRRLGPDSDVAISTYHGFGSALVARHARALGFANQDHHSRKPPRLIDFAQSLQLLLDIFDSAEFVQRKTGNPLFILREALALSSRLSDHLVEPSAVTHDSRAINQDPQTLEDLQKAARSRSELIPLIEQYRIRKRELGLIDHDDQIRLAVEAVRNIPGVADDLRQTYHAVLLDEYQDTNFAQRRLLQIVFGGTGARAITAVGDDMQSIYAFRGAHVSNLHHFLDHFQGADQPHDPARAAQGVAPMALSLSFRNDRKVLDLANRMQQQVPNAQPKVLTPRGDAADGDLHVLLASDSWGEARAIAHHIARLQNEGTPLREIAILCRKRRLIPPLVDALDEQHIAVEVVGIGGLLARPEIVELCCWLDTIAHPEERTSAVSVVRLLRGERYRIGVHDLGVLGRVGGMEAGLSTLDHLRDLSAEAHVRMGRFVAERTDLRIAATQLGLVELIEHVLAKTGLWGAVDGDRPMENLARFLHVAERFRPLQGRRSLHEFLSWLAVMNEAEEDLSEAVGDTQDAVQIMTIHQAKGLEFDHVIIPGLSGSKSSRVFPDTSRAEFPPTFGSSLPWWLREDNEGVDHPPQSIKELSALRRTNTARQETEEWRLFYVATTRARHSVLFTAAHWYFDTQTPQGPSDFYRWLIKQEDLVVSLGSSEPATSSPGIADRERRAEQARLRRDEEPRGGAVVTRRSRKRSVNADQLGMVLPAAAPEPTRLATLVSLPVSALVSLTRCARQFHWTHVRPMPRRASPAAILGTQIHSWIEQLGNGQESLFAQVMGETSEDRVTSERPLSDRLQGSFLASPYATTMPVRVEQSIVLLADNLTIRGRVDAAYLEPDGVLHVVDFKTGRPLDADDPARSVQLDLYGLAALTLWGADEDHLRTSAAYLRHDGSGVENEAETWSSARTVRANALLESSARRIHAGDRQPHVGGWCGRCPYLDLCPEGRNRSLDSITSP
jgi:DNA helicase II / ATP-dependent DNA helicase PcrA